MIMKTPEKAFHGNFPVQLLALFPVSLLAAARLLPAFKELMTSFRSYNPILGSQESPWVGIENYQKLFSDPLFFPALQASLGYGVFQLVFGAVAAVLAALILPKIPFAILRGIVLSGALLFSFLPEQLLLQWFFSLEMSLQINQFSLIYTLTGMLHQIGPAVLLGGAGACIMQKSSRSIMRLSGALLYIGLLLSQLFDNYLVLFELIRPATQAKSLFSLSYHFGLLQMQISPSAAIHTIINALQFVPAVLAALLLVLAIRQDDAPPQTLGTGSKQSIPALLALSILGVVLCVGATIYLNAGRQADSAYLPGGARNSLLTLALSFPLFIVYSAAGSGAASAGKRPWMPAILVVFSAISPGIVTQYLTVRQWGLINSVFGTAFYAALSLVPLAAMISFLLFLDLKQGLAYAVPLAGLGAVSIFTDILHPLVFITDTNRQGLPFYSYASHTNYTASPMVDFSSATIVILLVCLGIWAFSCIPLLRISRQSPLPEAPVPSSASLLP